jgi:hypothetical protein
MGKLQMKIHNKFFTPLSNLVWDKKYLEDFCKSLSPEDWYEFNCGGIRWTVREEIHSRRTECTNFERTDFFNELFNIFQVRPNYADILFTRSPPPGIPPHIDRNRSAAINFPASGLLKFSPMVWFDSFDSKKVIQECNHIINDQTTAILFDPKKIHGVLNEDDVERCLLSIWWRDFSYEDMVSKLEKGDFFNSNFIRNSRYFSLVTP